MQALFYNYFSPLRNALNVHQITNLTCIFFSMLNHHVTCVAYG